MSTIPSEFFVDNDTLQTVTFPNTITNIPSNAFKNCFSLTKIIIEKNKNNSIIQAHEKMVMYDSIPDKRPLVIFKGNSSYLKIYNDEGQEIEKRFLYANLVFNNLLIKIKHNYNDDNLKDVYRAYVKTFQGLKEIEYYLFL